jgi:uncharacterized RDD family membrane protein YckC
MYCRHCDFLNNEDDHRCLQCGRLLSAVVIAAPPSWIESVPGGTAPKSPRPAQGTPDSHKRVNNFPARRPAPLQHPASSGYVAPALRRVTAAAIDLAMVLLGFGTFLVTVGLFGSAFGSGSVQWIALAASLALLALFYGMIWVLAMRETAGMNWVELRLVKFDGTRVSGCDRAIRFFATWLGYASGGLGLLWALADEEHLAFHDLASKTYPAEKPNRT